MNLSQLRDGLLAAASEHKAGSGTAVDAAVAAVVEAVHHAGQDPAFSELLLRCLRDVVATEGSQLQELLDASSMDIVPRVMGVAACSAASATTAVQLAELLAGLLPPRDYLTTLLEVYDVHTSEAFDSSMHLLLLALLPLLPRLVANVQRRRLQCATSTFKAVAELATACGEQLDQHAAAYGALLAAGPGRASIDSSDLANRMQAVLQQLAQPFLQYCQLLQQLVLQSELPPAADTRSAAPPPAGAGGQEASAAARVQVCWLLLHLLGELSPAWTVQLQQQQGAPRPCARAPGVLPADLLRMLHAHGASTWRQLWEAACDEGSAASTASDPQAAACVGAAVAVLLSAADDVGAAPGTCAGVDDPQRGPYEPLLLPPESASETMQLGLEMCRALVQRAGASSSREQLLRALRLLALASQAAARALQRTQHGATQLRGATADASDPWVALHASGACESLPQLHAALQATMPALTVGQQAVASLASEVLQVVCINVVHSADEETRGLAHAALQAALGGLEPAVRAACLAALCAAPSPELAALLLQRLRQEVAAAAGLSLPRPAGPAAPGSVGAAASASSVFLGPWVLLPVVEQLTCCGGEQLQAKGGNASAGHVGVEGSGDHSTAEAMPRATASQYRRKPGNAAPMHDEGEVSERAEAVTSALSLLRFLLLQRQPATPRPDAPNGPGASHVAAGASCSEPGMAGDRMAARAEVLRAVYRLCGEPVKGVVLELLQGLHPTAPTSPVIAPAAPAAAREGAPPARAAAAAAAAGVEAVAGAGGAGASAAISGAAGDRFASNVACVDEATRQLLALSRVEEVLGCIKELLGG